MSDCTFTLGGSTIAAACGIDPYRSRVQLWAEMTELMPREPASEAALWGNLLEPVVRDEVSRRGYEIIPAPDVTLRDDTPWLVGHLDGYCAHGKPEPLSTRGVYEGKTTGPFVRGWENDGIPVPYVAQVSAYMYLADLDWALVACLVGGQRLEIRRVQRDDGLIAMLLEAGEEFLGYCTRNECPPPDGSKATAEVLKRLHPHANGETIQLTADDMETVRELRAQKQALKQAETNARELESVVKLRLGAAERGEYEGKIEVRYPTITAHVRAVEAHERQYRRLTL